MLTLLKPILLSFVKSETVKRFIVDLLKVMVKRSDNQVDDHAVRYIEQLLFPGSMPEK
tara:strand:- start:297 stop:470 length:174 start_codon:yes stop_codon:yes gene_type:complete